MYKKKYFNKLLKLIFFFLDSIKEIIKIKIKRKISIDAIRK